MVKKLLVAYGFGANNTLEALHHFARFDILDTGFDIGADAARIKELNPKCIILGYLGNMTVGEWCTWWPELNAHENWFLHDVNGNRLVHSYWGWYALDVGNVEYQNWFANFVKQQCNQNGFDGVFVDDVWDWGPYHNTVWTVPESSIPVNYQLTWHQRVLNFLRNVKAQLGTRLMIINGAGDYIDIADGFMIEDFMLSYYRTTSFNQFLANPTKICLCFGVSMPIDYTLACYLIGEREKTYWGYGTYADANRGYPSQMDIEEGAPIGAYSVSENVYTRVFQHLKSIVNVVNETGQIEYVETPLPSGCFIATACGTSNVHLSTLRRFRDQCLPTGLVHAYYRGSPPLANRIRPHENVKTVFRKVIEWLTCQLKRNLML